MGHATSATTEHYKRWAGRQMAEYGAYVPQTLAEGDEPERQQNDNNDSNKPRLRVFSA